VHGKKSVIAHVPAHAQHTLWKQQQSPRKKTDLFATQDKTNKQAGVVERMITNGEKGGEVGYLGPFLDPGSWHFNGMIERPQQPIPGTHGWALGVIAQTVSRNQHLQVV
jgi:hypothetical protein